MEVWADFIVLILVYGLCFYKKWQARGRDVLLVNTLMYVYLSCVIYFTLMPIITSIPSLFNHSYVPMNLIPFVDVLNNRHDAVRQIWLNILMTVPFGFLLPLVQKKMNLAKVMLASLLLSLSIELLQPLINSCRASDITDVLTNALGGMVGYILYIVFKPWVRKVLERVKK